MLVGACVCEYVVTLVIHLKDISGISTCTQFQMYFVVPISLFLCAVILFNVYLLSLVLPVSVRRSTMSI